MNDNTQTTSTEQVNAALAYVNRVQNFWKLDLKSCIFYARLLTRKVHI